MRSICPFYHDTMNHPSPLSPPPPFAASPERVEGDSSSSGLVGKGKQTMIVIDPPPPEIDPGAVADQEVSESELRSVVREDGVVVFHWNKPAESVKVRCCCSVFGPVLVIGFYGRGCCRFACLLQPLANHELCHCVSHVYSNHSLSVRMFTGLQVGIRAIQ